MLATLSTFFLSLGVGPEARIERLADAGGTGYVVAELSAPALEALRVDHDRNRTVEVALPLPDGNEAWLRLRPVDVWEEGGTARVVGTDGIERRLAPSVSLFTGYAPGRAGRAFVGVSKDFVHGYATLDGETFYLSSGKSLDRPEALRAVRPGGVRFTVAAASSFGAPAPEAWCHEILEGSEFAPVEGGSEGAGAGGDLPIVRRTQTFVEVDVLMREEFASDQETIDYLTLIVGLTDDVYRRDLAVQMKLPDGYLRVWNTAPPWGEGLPVTFSMWWNSEENPLADIPRAQVHLVSHVPIGGPGGLYFGGMAGTFQVCRRPRAYAWSAMKGSFAMPIEHTNPDNGDPIIFMHESGHVYGAEHAEGYGVDCQDGSGPDRGTIMGFLCLGNNTAGIGVRFHAVVQAEMREIIESRGCPELIPIQLGDYDANGAVDPKDFDEFVAYTSQGFESSGAKEAFDMNQDGIIDVQDRELLVAALSPPAATKPFNGSGANRDGYTSLNAPVLGDKWTATVTDDSGSPILTAILGSNLQLTPPQSTPFGELLIALPAFGGSLLFTLTEPTENGVATYEVQLPTDASLAGLTIETQALLFLPGRPRLTNGVSLGLGTYE